jgi:hypothetical protein
MGKFQEITESGIKELERRYDLTTRGNHSLEAHLTPGTHEAFRVLHPNAGIIFLDSDTPIVVPSVAPAR